MARDITLILSPSESEEGEALAKKAAAELGLSKEEIRGVAVLKRSVDARRKRVKIVLRCRVYTEGDAPDAAAGGADEPLPQWREADPSRRVVIVGAGPAGLFAALRLLEEGITPIIVEQGRDAATRKIDIQKMEESGRVNPASNYCFGEGGAGTFSDGKLYTRSRKRGNVAKIFSIFCMHGASPVIKTDARPHIGSDKLPAVIMAIRKRIIALGGEVRFNAKCTSLVVSAGRVCGVRTEAGDEILGDAVIYACGHSARGSYRLLADAAAKAGTHEPLFEAKTFAMGVRVEHPRALIDAIQLRQAAASLPAAEYRLSAQCSGRGVYTFCMCPGGIVVPAAAAPDEIVVNGMSPSSRNTAWSNSAVVVEVRAEDAAKESGCSEGAGLAEAAFAFQTQLGIMAHAQGDGLKAPAQRLTDFLLGRESATFPATSYAPGVNPSRLDLWLPAHISRRLKEAFDVFGAKMKGFVTEDALLIASETRTSSSIRIARDARTLECLALPGLYPAGEGAGYSGGIVSSAIDGERCAGAIIAQLVRS